MVDFCHGWEEALHVQHSELRCTNPNRPDDVIGAHSFLPTPSFIKNHQKSKAKRTTNNTNHFIMEEGQGQVGATTAQDPAPASAIHADTATTTAAPSQVSGSEPPQPNLGEDSTLSHPKASLSLSARGKIAWMAGGEEDDEVEIWEGASKDIAELMRARAKSGYGVDPVHNLGSVLEPETDYGVIAAWSWVSTKMGQYTRWKAAADEEQRVVSAAAGAGSGGGGVEVKQSVQRGGIATESSLNPVGGAESHDKTKNTVGSRRGPEGGDGAPSGGSGAGSGAGSGFVPGLSTGVVAHLAAAAAPVRGVGGGGGVGASSDAVSVTTRTSGVSGVSGESSGNADGTRGQRSGSNASNGSGATNGESTARNTGAPLDAIWYSSTARKRILEDCGWSLEHGRHLPEAPTSGTLSHKSHHRRHHHHGHGHGHGHHGHGHGHGQSQHNHGARTPRGALLDESEANILRSRLNYKVHREGVEVAAAWSVFHGDLGGAIYLLQKEADGTSGSSGAANGDSGNSRAQTASLAAMALAGFTTAEGAWRNTTAQLRDRVSHPYLVAALGFLVEVSSGHEGFSGVIWNKKLRLADRVAFAVRYLSDEALDQFIRGAVRQVVQEGDLNGILLTGLNTSAGRALLQGYLDRTADIQTVALLSAAGVLNVTGLLKLQEPGGRLGRGGLSGKELEWMNCYRELMDLWQLWKERGRMDATLGVREALPQVTARCNFCAKSLAFPTLGGDGPGAAATGGSRGPQEVRGKSFTCPSCNRALPRCALCLQTLGVMVPGMRSLVGPSGVSGRGAANKAPDTRSWFVWCQACGHGGHHNHLAEWFAVHEECPVADCACLCVSHDVRTILSTATSSK